jgi:hypothetical protein
VRNRLTVRPLIVASLVFWFGFFGPGGHDAAQANLVVTLHDRDGGPVRDLAFAAGGTELVALSDSGVVRIWRVDDWSRRRWVGHAELFQGARFVRLVPSARATAIVDSTGRMMLEEWETGALRWIPGCPMPGCTQLAAHGDLPIVAGLDPAGRLAVIDAQPPVPVQSALGVEPGSQLLGFPAALRRIMVLTPGGKVESFAIDTGKREDRFAPLAVTSEFAANVRILAAEIAPCGDWWCGLLEDRRLVGYNLDDRGNTTTAPASVAVSVSACAWFEPLAGRDELIYGLANGTLFVADPEPRFQRDVPLTTSRGATCRAASCDGGFVAFGHDDGSVIVLHHADVDEPAITAEAESARDGSRAPRFLEKLVATAIKVGGIAAERVDRPDGFIGTNWGLEGPPALLLGPADDTHGLVLLVVGSAGSPCAAPGDTISLRIGNLGTAPASGAVLCVASSSGAATRVGGDSYPLGEVAPGRWFSTSFRLRQDTSTAEELTLWLADAHGWTGTPWRLPICAPAAQGSESADSEP